jgi:hypothetical protein
MAQLDITKVILLQAYVRGSNARDIARNYRFVQLTCNEILQTEKTYLGNLQMVKKDYREPLESMSSSMKGIDESKLPLIFSNLEFLIPVSVDLINMLQPCFAGSGPDVARIGRVFLSMSPTLKYTYTRYINNYDQSLKTLQWANEHSPEFAKFLEDQQEVKALSLSAFLIMPVQRLPKYELLLREVLKYTPEGYDGHEVVVEAQNSINEVVTFINERKRSGENMFKVIEVVDTISGVPDGLFSLNEKRRFIIDAELAVRSMKKGKAGKEKPRQFMLFTDLLLVCKKNPFSKTKIHKFDLVVPLKEALVDVPQDPTLLKVILKDQMFTVVFDSEKDRNEWRDHLQNAGVASR